MGRASSAIRIHIRGVNKEAERGIEVGFEDERLSRLLSNGRGTLVRLDAIACGLMQ